MRRLSPWVLTAALVGALTGARDAGAITIDFESLAHTDSEIMLHVQPYSEDGFILTAPGGNLVSNGTLRVNFSGSTALFNGFVGGVQRITKDGGGAFSLISIDLSELNATQPTQVFTGFLAEGGTVTRELTLDGVAFGPETFVFDSSFGNLTAVEWTSPMDGSDGPVQYDNIVVGAPIVAVPVLPMPAVLVLALLLCAAAAAEMRRAGISAQAL